MDEIVAAQHFGHALGGIVDHHGQLVSRRSARFPDHEITAQAV